MTRTHRLFLVSILFSGISSLRAQDLTKDYDPERSSGSLPAIFLSSTETKTNEDIKKLTDHNLSEREKKKTFLLKSNYVLNEFILSGRVLVNDPVSKYVNKVADELLKDDPALRGQIQIFVTKSYIVNAYAFDKGVIFINMGLIAQLENEAQLAFVLAHEITHYVKKHSINAYVEGIKIDNADYRSTSMDEKELLKSDYSKENEMEADAEGLARINRSAYSLKAVLQTFDVLQYSYLPFDEVSFEKSFLESTDFLIPSEYFLKSVQEIKGADDYDDSKSTHPNVRKRREEISGKINYDTEAARKKYVVSEEEFKSSRDICRFEMCRLCLLERDYLTAIYSSYILLQKFPQNIFLHKVVAQSLYALADYKAFGNNYNSDRSDLIPSYERVEGKSQQVYHLFNKIQGNELAVMALTYAWNAHNKFPADPILNGISDSLFSIVANHYNLPVSSFSDKTREELRTELISKKVIDTTSGGEQSKYDRIRKQKEAADTVVHDVDLLKFSFVTWLKSDSEFKRRLNACARPRESVDRDKTHESSSPYPFSVRQSMKQGLSLGIDKIVIIDPFYIKVDGRQKDAFQYLGTEHCQQNYSDILASNAKAAGLDFQLIDPKILNADDIEKYNDFSVLNDWVRERIVRGTDNNRMPVFNTDQTKKLAAKYGTKYFLWSGIITNRIKKQDVGLTLLSCVLVITIPSAVVYLATPEYETLYYSVLFDIESGEVELLNVNKMEVKDSNDYLNTYVYDTLIQIKRAKKK